MTDEIQYNPKRNATPEWLRDIWALMVPLLIGIPVFLILGVACFYSPSPIKEIIYIVWMIEGMITYAYIVVVGALAIGIFCGLIATFLDSLFP